MAERAADLPTAAQLGLSFEPARARRRDDLATHVRSTLDRQLRVLLAQQRDAATGADPEAVHDMRVAIRRMRVALRLADGAIGTGRGRLPDDLRWLGGVLGEVRDLDVLLERLAAESGGLSAEDVAGFREIDAALHAAREIAQAALAEALAGDRYRALLQALADHIRLTTVLAAPEVDPDSVVRRTIRKLYRHMQTLDEPVSPTQLHRLRIRGKRVRYAAEQAARMAGRRKRKRLTKLADAARGLQDVLGRQHDAVAADERLRALAGGEAAGLSTNAVLVTGRLVEREAAHRAAEEARWPAAWQKLDDRASKLAA